MQTITRLSTGITGSGNILQGGMPHGPAYLMRDGPDCGKTTLGIQFPTRDTSDGQPVHNAGRKRRAVAGQCTLHGPEHGQCHRAGHFARPLPRGSRYLHSLRESRDVETDAIQDTLAEHAGRPRPARVFIDSLSHMRFLSASDYQFRKQVMSQLRALISDGATVVFMSEAPSDSGDQALSFLCDGTSVLVSELQRYPGPNRHTIEVCLGAFLRAQFAKRGVPPSRLRVLCT